MKKVLIVNNNMKVGGVQKSLYNLLWSVGKDYEITLLLFRRIGSYADRLPETVKVVECSSLFRYLGISQGECRSNWGDFLKRGGLAALSRLAGRSAAMKILTANQKKLPEQYDCAIAYLHNGRKSSFYGGVQEFVLECVDAERKIAFLHCDYQSSGANYPENDRILARFDRIAACSNGCGQAFASACPELKEKCVSVRNCHRIEEILALAEQEPVNYDPEKQNVILVSRLAREKGIERAVEAAASAIEKGLPIVLHIVGGGPMKQMLQEQIEKWGIAESVYFYGEQENPYRFMKKADLFLLPSYHEAAPMVIEEAHILGLPVLTTRTTSSDEMVLERGIGWVCENTQEDLTRALVEVLQNRDALREKRERIARYPLDNRVAEKQFKELIEESYENKAAETKAIFT